MPGSIVMMKLGDFAFGIDTAAYQELEREYSWRWAKVERLMSKPVNQFVGPDLDAVTLRGVIYPAFARNSDGLAQVPAMKAAADKGEAMVMVDGNGRVWGDFCIERLRETQSAFMSDGSPRKVEFEITLREEGEFKRVKGTVPVTNASGRPLSNLNTDIPTQTVNLNTGDWS